MGPLRRTVMYVGYGTRWIWDTPPKPFQLIPHYYYPDMSAQDQCRLNGLSVHQGQPRRLFDAIPFSIELDLLEIRLHELMDVVDKFVLVESNVTFTGYAKPLLFQQHRKRFAFAEHKIIYATFHPQLGQDAFVTEGRMRNFINDILKHEVGISDDDVLLMSDTDEIPYKFTLDLFKNCDGLPAITHLQLKNYMYSFQFHVDMDSWRAQVHYYNSQTTTYQHMRSTDLMLGDAGWHCSFCFPAIEDYVFKMTAYSHHDRVHSDYYLSREWIQRAVCEGLEIFGFLPEVYSLAELMAKSWAYPRTSSGVLIPRFLIENSRRFQYLLPGSNNNCTRL